MSSETRSVYAITTTAIAVSAPIDLLEFSPAANKPCVLHAIFISQTAEPSTEEEQIRIDVIRGHTASGSGGSPFTPIPLVSDDAAAAFSCEVNNTTIASGGTPVVLHTEAFNTRAGLVYIPTPEMRAVFKVNTTGCVVRIATAPADAITLVCTFLVEER